MEIDGRGGGYNLYQITQAGLNNRRDSSEKSQNSLDPTENTQDSTNTDENKEQQNTTGKELSDSEEAYVDKLEQADRNVRAHEAAHVAAGGSLVRGGANFQYETGPDGKIYAVAGEVSIDTGEGNTPEETVSKMQQVKAAAMAPGDPSPQDYRVAASAAVMEARARAEIAKEASEEIQQSMQGEENAYGEDASEKGGFAVTA